MAARPNHPPAECPMRMISVLVVVAVVVTFVLAAVVKGGTICSWIMVCIFCKYQTNAGLVGGALLYNRNWISNKPYKNTCIHS